MVLKEKADVLTAIVSDGPSVQKLMASGLITVLPAGTYFAENLRMVS
jgi:hypothetical protein